MLGGFLLLLAAVPVIAAPPPADQQATAVAAPDTSFWARYEWLVIPLMAVCAGALLVSCRWYRLPRQPRYRTTLTPPLAGMLFAGMLCFGVVGASLALSLFGAAGETEPAMRQAALVMIGAYALQAVIVGFWAATERRLSARGMAPPVGGVLLGIGGLILFWPLAMAVGALAGWLIQRLGGEVPDLIAHETLRMLTQSPTGVWHWLVIGLVLTVAPLFEEIAYRGLLQNALRSIGLKPWVAIVATSLVFSLMHIGSADPQALAALFTLSLGFGWVVEKSGRLTSAVVMHSLFNLGNIVLAMA